MLHKTQQTKEELMQTIKVTLKDTRREGIDRVINILEAYGFFTCPASTKFHLTFEGGLMVHSWNVYFWMLEKNRQLNLKMDENSIAIAGLLHDICKTKLYVKNQDGSYSYTTDPNVKARGHAKLSLEMLKPFIKLTEEEEAMILYHMGLFGCETKEYTHTQMLEAIKKFASVQIFASADMESSQFEKNGNGGVVYD